MTRRLPFSQASLRRAIAAARKEGLRVVGIRPDGTLITANVGENPFEDVAEFVPEAEIREPSRWEDVKA